MCLDPLTQRIYISRHVIFDEHVFSFSSPSQSSSSNLSSLPSSPIPSLLRIFSHNLESADGGSTGEVAVTNSPHTDSVVNNMQPDATSVDFTSTVAINVDSVVNTAAPIVPSLAVPSAAPPADNTVPSVRTTIMPTDNVAPVVNEPTLFVPADIITIAPLINEPDHTVPAVVPSTFLRFPLCLPLHT